QTTYPKLLQASGYQTAIFGKWHLGHGGNCDPTGFDYWNVLPGQGFYHNPEFIEMGVRKIRPGYVTDLITDDCLQWLEQRDRERPFCLMCHHKAPHRRWEPDDKHLQMYDDIDIPEPDTLFDDY
ncbi:sulfatase-like hydrolase/transferase, partial [Escherichia coli]